MTYNEFWKITVNNTMNISYVISIHVINNL